MRRSWLLFFLAACASSQHVVVSIRGLTCSDCGGELEQRAAQLPGVRAARFDTKRSELSLDLAPGTNAEPLAAKIAEGRIDGRPIEAVVGAGHGAFATFTAFEPGWDAKVLSQQGEDVAGFDLAQGKVTVVDFSARWCGPCHELDEQLHELLKASPDRLAYRRIDIVDWDSPVARHWLTGASELPYLIVFDGHGQEVGRIAGLKPDALKAAIEKGGQ